MSNDEAPTSSNADVANQAWIEDGILYMKYSGEVTMETVSVVGTQAAEIIKQGGYGVMPAILDLIDVDDSKANLHFSNLGKILTSYNDVVKHESVLIVVGAKDNALKLIGLLGKVFLNGRIEHVDSMAEAKSLAHNYSGGSSSILE